MRGVCTMTKCLTEWTRQVINNGVMTRLFSVCLIQVSRFGLVDINNAIMLKTKSSILLHLLKFEEL